MPITIQLLENGNLWKQLLNPASVSAIPTLLNYLTPSPQFLGAVGREVIRSVRGDTQGEIIVDKTGHITEHMTTSYENGILQRREPSGKPFKKLSQKTMKNRYTKHQTNPDVSLDASHILRETGKHILGERPQRGGGGRGAGRGGLRILGVDWGRGYGAVTLGYIDQESEERAIIHDQGFGNNPRRHFLGLQSQFFENLQKMGAAWLNRENI